MCSCPDSPTRFLFLDSPGHIPGAKLLTMKDLVNIDTGVLRSLEELKASEYRIKPEN